MCGTRVGEVGERAEGSLDAFQGNLQVHLPLSPLPPYTHTPV